MRHEQALQPVPHTATDAERRHLVGQRCAVAGLQGLECANHAAGSGQIRATGIGTELTLATEPHHDRAGQDTEHQLGNNAGHIECRSVAALGLEHHLVHQMAHNA